MNPKPLSILRAALTCALVFSFGLPTVAGAQSPWPPVCQEGSLPGNDPLYPADQLILICVPPNWNGLLVVYAHGYAPAQAPLALPADQFALTAPAVLLSQGFAFATSSYHKNGYAVEQGGNDLNALVAFFNTLVPPGSLHGVYLIGASEGGLIVTMLIERRPEIYSGGLAICGPVGGAPLQVKHLGDFRVVFDYFFPDVFPFGAANVPPTAFLDWDTVYVPAIAAAMASNPAATEQLFNVTQAARDPLDPANSAISTAVGNLFYSIWGTSDLIATAGGQPFNNRFTRYTGSNNDAALNAGVERVRSDRAARAYVRKFYQTTGELERPLVTLHTTLDPVVPFKHELLYFGLAASEEDRDNQFLTVQPVPRYGHCNFTPDEVLQAFGLLVSRAGG